MWMKKKKANWPITLTVSRETRAFFSPRQQKKRPAARVYRSVSAPRNLALDGVTKVDGKYTFCSSGVFPFLEVTHGDWYLDPAALSKFIG